MIKDLTTKEVRKRNGFVKYQTHAPDGRFPQDWILGGVTYKSALFQAKKYPQLLTVIVNEESDKVNSREPKPSNPLTRKEAR